MSGDEHSEVLTGSRPDAVEEWLRRLPKAEVHVHLEGCIEADDARRMALQTGVPFPGSGDGPVAFDSLPQLLDYLDWACGLIDTPAALARLAYQAAARETAAGVRYADFVVNPTHWPVWADRLDQFVAALDAGFAEAEQDGLARSGLCVSIRRDQTETEAVDLVDRLLSRRCDRVVALSIDGDERTAGRSSPRFAQAFRAAAGRGLHRTVHAGESSGPEGVRDAIDLLGAERVDHGVRAVEESALVRELADRQIPLGICPTSNIALGLYTSYREHPVERLRHDGVLVSINTDDPALMNIRLEQEYALVGAAFDWDAKAYLEVARNSIVAAFCDDDLRRDLLTELEGLSSSCP